MNETFSLAPTFFCTNATLFPTLLEWSSLSSVLEKNIRNWLLLSIVFQWTVGWRLLLLLFYYYYKLRVV